MVDVAVLKELRDRTDAPINRCKEALEKAEGDIQKAIILLSEEGVKVAAKKSTRETGTGIVEAYIHGAGRIGVLLEIRSETDFVARNPAFKQVAHDIAMHIAAANPATTEEMNEQPFVKDESKTVGDVIKETIARFGENIQVTRFTRFDA
ncbi:MAG: translation elongation factor Ts [Candidatus Ryanbacteria bacterium CG10_big_fil_rev_8_21_14_0_10_43_42]|uniref:Elongation factor Ts n=1 Tax=Candidatus Ryanbacteria bacterium CG10_big_fil_rev_8_21_14_0_10_43_42 TaxID=1974864 RepID=A0A2M8KWY9_9BACT|nr:MAG: translation elongation factor Ts [Candidatus Ryanbacteria bacterium CG10_big_fil_rev_8_21_14_0_10_43_42]